MRLSSIARALGVSVEELFTEDDAAAYRGLILDLMRDLSPSDRDTLIRMARALASQKQGKPEGH